MNTSELDKGHWFRNSVTRDGNGMVPSLVVFDGQAWRNSYAEHRQVFESVKAECPDVGFHIPPEGQAIGRPGEETIIDAWGCKWLYNTTSGDGQAISHPLQRMTDLSSWQPPNPDTYLNWEALAKQIDHARAIGEPSSIGTEHGFFFLRLTYLRGFDGLMMDIAEQSEDFLILLEKVTNFWVEIGQRIAELKPDIVNWADDLGMQHSLPMNPRHWRQFIKPAYARIMSACKSNGAKVSLHTDGYIVDIIPDLIDCGVDVINPQDSVNGLDNLANLAKGKISINLDIDRQFLTPFGKPEEVTEHIGQCIKALGSPEGGLSLTYGIYTGVPVENIVALVRAMQKYHDYWVETK